MMFKICFLFLTAGYLYSCANGDNGNPPRDAHKNIPVPIHQISRIIVTNASLHGDDYKGLSFELNDSLVRVEFNSTIIDSGRYSIDSTGFKMELKTHAGSVTYDLGFSDGELTELKQRGTNQVLSVSVK